MRHHPRKSTVTGPRRRRGECAAAEAGSSRRGVRRPRGGRARRASQRPMLGTEEGYLVRQREFSLCLWGFVWAICGLCFQQRGEGRPPARRCPVRDPGEQRVTGKARIHGVTILRRNTAEVNPAWLKLVFKSAADRARPPAVPGASWRRTRPL